MSNFYGLMWLLLVLGPLLFLQRRLHREIQEVLLLITRKPKTSMILFSLLFLPGILLRVLSQRGVASGLGWKLGRFSLLPIQTPDGRLRLGYVEMEKPDLFSDALIGAAPLFTGAVLVGYLGMVHLKLGLLWSSLVNGTLPIRDAFATITGTAGFWLWFYLAFTFSSMMLPSKSDRRAWPSLALWILALFGFLLLGGAGPWMLAHLAPLVGGVIAVLAMALSVGGIVHMVLLLPVWALRKLLNKLTGLKAIPA